MTTLTARTLITSIGEIEYPVLEISDDGLITDISSDPSVHSDRILAPTFMDIHIHGAAGHDVMDQDASGQAFAHMTHFLASRGTAHFLPTTVTASVDATLQALGRLATRIEQAAIPGDCQPFAIPLGIHLEGPFLSHAKRGVHPADRLQRPSVELFEQFQQAARGHIRLLTLAPEVPGALDLIRHASGQGVRVSLGHSNATGGETAAALAAGAASATHTFNAMRPLDHRDPGILGTVLDTSSLFAELICDGIHVHPAMVRLWLRSKGDQAILITDAMAATGMPDGAYHLGSLAVTVETLPHAPDGTALRRCTLTESPETLAGSVLTLDQAVSNLQRFTGCPLAQAVRCASANAASLLGLQASLHGPRPGQPAHLNQFTPAGQLERTYLWGKPVPPAQ